MSERELLERLAYYGHELAAALAADRATTLDCVSQLAYEDARAFDDTVLPLLLEPVTRRAFTILHQIAIHEPARRAWAFARWIELAPALPDEAVDELYYVSTNEPELWTPWLVTQLLELMPANACQAFRALGYLLVKRPELVQAPAVEAVLRHLRLQVNQAYYFLREVVKARPDLVPLCTLALFECVLHEPHAWMKREMVQEIVQVADRSHVRSELDRALRMPVAHGSRGARALMAVLFRQKLRQQQHVLFEALDLAVRWTAVWDFVRFLLEVEDAAISTAAVEEFLEETYRLSLLVSPYEFEQLVAKKLAATTEEAPPPEVSEELHPLWRRVAVLAPPGFEVAPLVRWRTRRERLAREIEEVEKRGLDGRLRRLREEMRLLDLPPAPKEKKELAKALRKALVAAARRFALESVREAAREAYRAAARRVFGADRDLSKLDERILPALAYLERLGRGYPKNRRYLARLFEDRIDGRSHDWLWTEEPAAAWAGRVREVNPGVRLERWRATFVRGYDYTPASARAERERRAQVDIERVRSMLLAHPELELEGIETAGVERLRDVLALARTKGVDVSEAELDLERVRIAAQAADSDYEGRLELAVETDPFRYLFMGEYGFASCLSLRGTNVWSAVSNAIDVDKAVVWAREPGGNVVGRRLLALTPEGVVSYRTYANRHGLALDGFFERFVAELAAHVGVGVARGVRSGALLSDRWYDDGPL